MTTLAPEDREEMFMADIADGTHNAPTPEGRKEFFLEDMRRAMANVPEVVDNVESTSAEKALSANMGRELNEEITNLKAIGRFLSIWDATTGLPDTNPPKMPYTYKTGDYYIVGTVGTTNLKPNGATYSGAASTTTETEEVNLSDIYYYDGSVWKLQRNSGRTMAVDDEISTTSENPVQNKVIAEELAKKAPNGTDYPAHNSVFRGKDLTNVYTIEQLSAKVQAGDFSDIYVGDFITKNVTINGATESVDFVVAGINYWLNVGDTELTRNHLLMIPRHSFNSTIKMNDTNTTTGGYYGSKAHGITTGTYTSTSITAVVVDYTTFKASDLGATDGEYEFTYTGSKWYYNDTQITLSTYGISLTGTASEGDKVKVTLTTGYLEPYRQAIYNAFGDSHILTHRSYQTVSTSSSQWHNARVELMNECMVYGCKIFTNNNYGEMIAPSQLPLFRHAPNWRVAKKGKSGSRYYWWLSSISGGAYFCGVGSIGLANYNNASYACAVRPYFLFA